MGEIYGIPVAVKSGLVYKNNMIGQIRKGSRASGTNPRALGTNPRALGTNPKVTGIYFKAPRQARRMSKKQETELWTRLARESIQNIRKKK